MKRRGFLTSATGAAGVAAILPSTVFADKEADGQSEPTAKPRKHPIGVSTYSFWRFNSRTKLSIEDCIDAAAKFGFDGVEILEIQMDRSRMDDNSYMQQLKQRAFLNGLDLCGFSTHQGFVYPDKAKRQSEIDKTIHQIELAYKLAQKNLTTNW